MSITGYHPFRKPREEGAVEAGTMREARLGGGVIRYREVGTGPTLAFVHGILANGTLWRDVVSQLSGRFRCIVPDLPLGGHSVPMLPEADMSPAGVARMVAGMVADLMETLDVRDVTLVGNDTGGAICQIVISNYPERVGRLVLTNCDAYEAFFPALLRLIQYAARLFGTRFVSFSRGRSGRVSRSGRSSRPSPSGTSTRPRSTPMPDACCRIPASGRTSRGSCAGSPGGTRLGPRRASLGSGVRF
jgi:pimeloyl-ACP methyl ester carboxylesterase